jgi:hypothetical protein
LTDLARRQHVHDCREYLYDSRGQIAVLSVEVATGLLLTAGSDAEHLGRRSRFRQGQQLARKRNWGFEVLDVRLLDAASADTQ